MSITEAMITSAKAGALIGAVGGTLPLVAGLCWGERKKAVLGLSACVLAGAIGGTYAVIPASLITFTAINRARQEKQAKQESMGLVFSYSRLIVWLGLLGMPVLAVTSLVCIVVAAFGIARPDVTIGMKLNATFVGLLGVAFGWVTVVAARYWYALFTEYTVTEEGVKIRYRASTDFAPWPSLRCAKYSKAFGQIELDFEGYARRVILSNVDLDPQRRRVLEVLGLIERATGRPVLKSLL
ncbi:MAG TPA: hypothetical protein PL152_00975 [Steroidobacteraceae bacterium]|nr:hypothetical protein [Steroidobacteraceae bacterium]